MSEVEITICVPKKHTVMKPKILILYRNMQGCLPELEARFNLVFPEEGEPIREEMLRLIPDCEGLFSAFNVSIDREIMMAAPKLKIIANYAVGYDNIDVAFATERGIAVANTPDPVVEPTAELAFGLMIAAARRIAECDRRLREDNIRWGLFENLGTVLIGKTLGIIGMGRIGQAVARRASASCMKVVYHNRTRLAADIEQKYDAQYLSFDELLATSDYVSLNMPLNAETHHLIDRAAFEKMKQGAILINTARGAVVDEAALTESLRKGKLRAAGLDVYEFEPKITPELLTMDNVVLAPHNGTAATEVREEMMRYTAGNIVRFFDKQHFACVNPKVL
ncbi:D-glycerate dehydrogenase [Bacteroidia bacterium]|nr:D-glycerate dehydrogenase [Bacteroidia bacterium]